MAIARGYAATDASKPLAPFTFERREPRDDDVVIDIKYCGVCHSDIHQARDEWGNSTFPMVPGHEIVGIVRAVGSQVTRFKIGDRVVSAASSTPARPAPSVISTWSSICRASW